MRQKNYQKWAKNKIGPKDAQCSEINAEPIFLVYEIWSILCSKLVVNWEVIRMCLRLFWEPDSGVLCSLRRGVMGAVSIRFHQARAKQGVRYEYWYTEYIHIYIYIMVTGEKPPDNSPPLKSPPVKS